MKDWLLRRPAWTLAGAVVLFLVGFQLVESVVGPVSRPVARVEPGPEPEPAPVAIEVTRPDSRTVRVSIGDNVSRTQIGMDSDREADEMFACVNDGIAEAIERDPSLAEPTPPGRIARRAHGDRVVARVQGVTSACVSGATSRERAELR